MYPNKFTLQFLWQKPTQYHWLGCNSFQYLTSVCHFFMQNTVCLVDKFRITPPSPVMENLAKNAHSYTYIYYTWRSPIHLNHRGYSQQQNYVAFSCRTTITQKQEIADLFSFHCHAYILVDLWAIWVRVEGYISC